MTQGIRKKIICFTRRQVKQIKNGGLPVLSGKLRVFLLIMPVALVVLAVVRALRFLVVIRFGPLRGDRIAHFVVEPVIYLWKRDTGIFGRKYFDFFYYTFPICNLQVKMMLERTLHVFQFARWLDWLNRRLPWGEKHIIPELTKEDFHFFGMRTQAYFSFTPEEESRGKIALQELGIPKDAPFVCFFARDSTYLDTVAPHINWRYHDFRNSSIYNYLPAVEELSSRGYYLFRMGSVVKERLNTVNPRIIDYAKNYRSDFLDIYLSAKCCFFLSDTSGISEVSRIFWRPIAYVNIIPLGIDHLFLFSSEKLFIPKRLWLRKEQKFLTFREMINSEIGEFSRSEQYERFGVEIVENTPQEITALAMEMDERLKGTWQMTEEDEELQRRFWLLFNSGNLYEKFVIRIGTEFLRQNCELLK